MTSQYIGDKLSPIYCDVISSVIIRESMTSHGHMTHQEKDRIFRGSGDEDLLTLSPIYCDVIARVIIRESMTSHGHMTHQEKDRIFRGSGDEDLLTLSPIL